MARTELIELPDGSSIEGPLYGSQMPRLYVEPERHRDQVDGCVMCALEASERRRSTGCGESNSIDALQWAQGYGYELDPWQKWCCTNMMSVKPDGMWAASDCLLIVSRQNGKGDLSVTEPLLTVNRGWVTHLDIAVGDYVLGSDGKPTEVLYRSPVFNGRNCYEVEFTDGSRVVASQYHLWHVQHKSRSLWENISTEDLYAGTGTRSVGYRRPDNGRMEYNWRVRCDAVPQTTEADLPIDPYLLGFWLGDGSANAPQMTIGREDYDWAVQRLYKAGARKSGWETLDAAPEGSLRPSATGHECYHVNFRIDARMRDGFCSRLKRLGIWGDKRIPEEYLTASVAQRKAILAGLMDTDGSITCNNKAPQCEFSTSFPGLARDFHRLARSLGIRVTPKWRETAGKDSCRFLFTAPFNPFEMPRKAARWKAPASTRHELMSIVAITPVESVPTRCIKVAAPDGVYLTGELFTPTHNTILEVRELAGLFVFEEELLIHTAHQFKTSVNHFNRLKRVLNEYPALMRRVKRIAGSHGEESIELHSSPTLIFGSGRNQVKKGIAPVLAFHARAGSGGTRGFSCDCLVYDEGMILSDEVVGASMPTMSARPNPQIILAGSAGLKDSFQMAKSRNEMLRGAKDMFAAEWSINAHTEECPRDMINGRKSNYYIVCDKHDDRDDPRSWAIANPATGYRIRTEFTRKELAKMPELEFDRERNGVGEWPPDEEAWEVISQEKWRSLTNVRPGFPVQPIAFGCDIAEDGTSATISSAWSKGRNEPIVIEIPRNCSRPGSDWVVDKMDAFYKKWHPVVMVVPKSGPAAGILAEGRKRWGDRLMEIGPGEEAAAFAWFMQAVKANGLTHFGEQEAPTLWHAMGRATTRVVGDGGKAWSRRDSLADITPVTSGNLVAYALDVKHRTYDLMKTIA